MNMRTTKWHVSLSLASGALLLLAIPTLRAQSKGVVVEEIVARVNNQIIALSDYDKAQQELRHEIEQGCQGCPPDKIDAQFKDGQKNLVRDLIDQQLLIERAKDMDISVDTQLIKQLDEIRKKNTLASLEDLEKAVEAEGISWEDFKTQTRNKLLTDEVISREVAGRIDLTNEEIKQFYEAHKNEFVLPEQVSLAEIFLSTEGKTPEEAGAIQKKAEDLRARIVKGDDFGEIAKRYSEGQTAKDGGDLGLFQRGQLSKQIEDLVLTREKNDITEVIQTKTGFEILKVVDHFQAGQQPFEKVEDAIANRIRMSRMEPAMRDYLAGLREESYVWVKPGYTDSAALVGGTNIQEVAPTPDTPKKGKGAKKKLPLPKVNGS
jgi:peptidyl-prolyl cis-trans isomerase SurA